MYSASADITRPDAEIEDYYEEYQNNPIISAQIDHLALEVFEPGYWIEADDPETESQIEEFVENIGIQGSKTHIPLSKFGKLMLKQHEIRGTFDGEKVTDDQGRHVALNPVNPSTLEIYTKPGPNVLLPPDFEARSNSSVNIKQTADGDVAAFVQFDRQFSRWTDRNERRFTRDEILHWPRNPDIGEQFGHSRIETVYERSRALREKFQDNDLAISMKAWPMVLFQMGSEERPWTREQMENFMSEYEEQNLGPGMYQGVPGDVDVEEFAGETADITEHVQADVDMIVSGMPGPKHTLGSFSETSAPDAHERQFHKVVRSKRRAIEDILTPYLREVAESWGYDPSGLELHIGRPDGDVAPEDIQGSIIRYQSDADSDGETEGEGERDTDGPKMVDSPTDPPVDGDNDGISNEGENNSLEQQELSEFGDNSGTSEDSSLDRKEVAELRDLLERKEFREQQEELMDQKQEILDELDIGDSEDAELETETTE